MTEMFGEAWSPMSVPDLAPDDDDQTYNTRRKYEIWAEPEQNQESYDCLECITKNRKQKPVKDSVTTKKAKKKKNIVAVFKPHIPHFKKLRFILVEV